MRLSGKINKLLIVLLLLCCFASSCTPNIASPLGDVIENSPAPTEAEQTSTPAAFSEDKELTATPQPTPTQTAVEITQDLAVHFLDVGQGDSVFIELPTAETMLIDAGESEYSDEIIKYIDNLGYNTIDYIIATHPHADHIGGMAEVIEHFAVGSIYLPKVQNNTQTFENLLTTIQSKGLTINTAKAGKNIIQSPDLKLDIVAPNSDSYDDINDFSAVIKLTYKNRSFLFMGDAEAASEREIQADVKSDVIKIGHHGSESSTSQDFLEKVSPGYAVISVGANNNYGHPTDKTLSELRSVGASINRTDENGTIVFTSDGKSLLVNISKEKATPTPTPTPAPVIKETPTPSPSINSVNETTVYVTNSGSKYHRNGCRYLSKSKIPISLDDAALSYSPCSVCGPPIMDSSVDSTYSAETTQKPDTAVSDKKEVTVYITKTGSKYHKSGCQYLSKSKIPISLDDAKASGYSACSKCGPPR